MTDEEVIHAAYDRIDGWNIHKCKRWFVPVIPRVSSVPFSSAPEEHKSTFEVVEFEFVTSRNINGTFAQGILGTYKDTTIVVKHWLAPHRG